MSEGLEVALALTRFLTYGGYVLIAGTLAFWVLVWPGGRRDPRLVRAAMIGAALMALGAVLDPISRVTIDGGGLGDVLAPAEGATLLVRLAALAAAAFFLADVVRASDVIRPEELAWWRVFATGLVVMLAGTLVARPSGDSGVGEAVGVLASAGHLLALAIWLGGLVVLAAVRIPSSDYREFDLLIPRFAKVVTGSVVVLVVTGLVRAVEAAGGVGALASSGYGLVVLLKVAAFGALLVLGHRARQYARRVAPGRHTSDTAPDRRTAISATRAVVVAEVGLALGILALTAVLGLVAPS